MPDLNSPQPSPVRFLPDGTTPPGSDSFVMDNAPGVTSEKHSQLAAIFRPLRSASCAPSPASAVGSPSPLQGEEPGPVTDRIGHTPDSSVPVSPQGSRSVRF